MVKITLLRLEMVTIGKTLAYDGLSFRTVLPITIVSFLLCVSCHHLSSSDSLINISHQCARSKRFEVLTEELVTHILFLAVTVIIYLYNMIVSSGPANHHQANSAGFIRRYHKFFKTFVNNLILISGI
jgi:hypothetical protein